MEDYDLMPHQQILDLKKQIDDMKAGPSTKKLLSSMEDLKASIGELNDLFHAASEEMKQEEKEDLTISRKLDKVMNHNKVIAEAILALSKKIEDMPAHAPHPGPHVPHTVPPPTPHVEQHPAQPEAPAPTVPGQPAPGPSASPAAPAAPPQSMPGGAPETPQPPTPPPPLPGMTTPEQPTPTGPTGFEPPEFAAPDFNKPLDVPMQPQPNAFGAPEEQPDQGTPGIGDLPDFDGGAPEKKKGLFGAFSK